MRYILIQGELCTMSPVGFLHDTGGTNIILALGQHEKPRQLGMVVGADVGFVLTWESDPVRLPGGAFARREWISDPRPAKFREGVSALAVEVALPSLAAGEVDDCSPKGFDGGAREVIVLYSRQHAVQLGRARGVAQAFRADVLLAGLEALPECRCPAADIFA